ncbi:hypothetical protein OIO90_003374 [Microbotryomycetes sp. JL221]|nr:hypothetical protein OIO90_003374 [Microbotryomycetes sp. JL221]
MTEDYFTSHRLAADGAPPPITPVDERDTPSSASSEELQNSERLAAGHSTQTDKALPEISSTRSNDQHHRKLAPDEIVAVLGKDQAKVPEPQRRFLHGGPPLSELEAPSTVPLGALTSLSKQARKDGTAAQKPIANARWRAFTDEEEKMLQQGWQRYDRERTGGDTSQDKDVQTPATDEDPVGLDRLFTVDLSKAILMPAFWSGTPVRVIQAHWFYPPPSTASSSTPSHNLKPYPVDPELSGALDRAYASIRPWEESYSMELASALKGGITAQMKLAAALDIDNESGANGGAGSGLEVIFTNETECRLYSKSIIGSVGKSFFSSGSGLGGGQVVIRGWDAMRTYHERRLAAKRKSQASLKVIEPASDSSRDSSPARQGSNASTTTTKPEAAKPAESGGLFGYLKSKIYGAPDIEGKDEQEKASVEERTNETSEAMAGPRNREGERGIGDVGDAEELCIVIHGIGQKLAGQYESFNFVHAVNQLRSACTTLSTSSTLAPLLHSKRAQFIPLLWRADLEFDDESDDEDDEDEHLHNRFSIEDVEIKGSIPFLRTIARDLVLDVPLYQSHHKSKMTKAVVKEANRIYRLFCARNPGFATNGRVSIIAHSLGSALTADILSSQPTFVKPLKEMTRDERFSETEFVFDTKTLILVGSPLAFFLHLGRGQLIARAGRERTKGLGKAIALDRAGRYGCMAVDSVYNVFYETDPVAFALNATVDVACVRIPELGLPAPAKVHLHARRYSKLIKPVAIPSTNHTLLENLSETYQRVSRMFSWSSGGDDKKQDKGSDKSNEPEAKDKSSTTEQSDEQGKTPDDVKAKLQSTPIAPKLLKRPTNKRMPSERPMNHKQLESVLRAEQRFKALNPNGCVDFYLPAEGFNQYVEALSSHGAYWNDPRFSNFVLLQLFASSEDLERTGREEIGEEEAEEEEADDDV